MAFDSVASAGFTKLVDDTVKFAMKIYGGVVDNSLDNALKSSAQENNGTPTSSGIYEETRSPEAISIAEQAKALMAEFEKTGDIRLTNQAVSILQSYLDLERTPDNDRHYILFTLSLTLCRRVEIQLSNQSTETLLDLHLILTRCVFLLRQAVNLSPPAIDVKIKYLCQLGHTATLWSTTLSSRWPDHDVLELLAKLKAEQDDTSDPMAEKITGFVSAVVMASTLSTAFGATKNPEYRNEGRVMYRRTLRSIRDVLPLDAMIDPIDSMDFMQKLRALLFIKDGLIPFILQVMAVLMQSLVEVPLSAVVGRRAAAMAMDKGLYQQGVEWLEQCLMLVWGQLNLRAPAPQGAIGARAESEGGMGQIVHAFLGLCVYVDVVGDKGVTIAHPEQLAYLLLEEWLKVRNAASNDPIFKDLFKERSFDHLLNAARTTPVVMLNLWGSQCNALILYGEGRSECFRLDGVTEEFAAKLQTNFRDGLQSAHFRSRGDEALEEHRGDGVAMRSSIIHRVLAALWHMIVKPILDKMKLSPIENPELDPPRLTWCPTGPTSFFPLHAAGLYGVSQVKGTKIFEYVASSYTPTLSILADTNIALSREPEPFKGILAISQPAMDGQTPIPMTVSEVEALIAATTAVKVVDDNIKVQWLKDAEVTKEAVLSGMESSTWVHLACHARQYPLNTSESAFMLANGEMLSLADISTHVASNGELAFLSACQTAAGDFDLSEEGVHLAAGMLVAGYRGVIATTWSVRDQDAPIVAAAVYRRLLDGGNINRSDTALALHHGARLLREQVGQDEVMRWAPFIHLGI
ncbi:hypothetical protein HYPSUDRAFT_67092 [Hypholoma sublateritium FD-334 SS-4]|uniref:CHAT domain-containing protein n=1 Tax=Hypholoma sublateritium (strain FD-334 SS-4) TaxID=945553 RepID=A0A0D2MFP6_HYPSF|nr:hypothetical protein HYPSUDRAFT_67092 [Hypholoma sublateritium FD-334 SS-4]